VCRQARRIEEDTGALKTSVSQAKQSPTWKQEVNQRVAAHRNRNDAEVAPTHVADAQHTAGKRAAGAAARVAARYAKAPSFSEMLAEEARAAVRAAEAASEAAHEAQAAAESVLASLNAELESRPVAQPPRETEIFAVAAPTRKLDRETGANRQWIEPVLQSESRPESANAGESGVSVEPTVEWEPETLPRLAEPAPVIHARHGIEKHWLGVHEVDREDWRGDGGNSPGDEGDQPTEASQPIHANLIEFPRELVATRKARPRLVEGPRAAVAEPNVQLSIFEVDPGSISLPFTEGEQVAETATPAWPVPEWTGIKLDAQPEAPEEATTPEPANAPAARALQPAPAGARMMAAVVDFALITAAFLTAALMVATNAKYLPGMREIELYGTLALMLTGVLYEALFHTLANATPGMKYARISLCTFTDESPDREQRWARVGALMLSLLPLGLGMVWLIFDEEHLCWHDRLSQTYLRKC
jgi:uncharacterized RDD family membrane protein YckC